MFFKKKKPEDEEWYKKLAEKEVMLLNMVTDTGLALTPEEKEDYKKSGWIDTGKFNGHGQPLVKNVETGEVLAVCRIQPVSTVCGYFQHKNKTQEKNPCGNAYHYY